MSYRNEDGSSILGCLVGLYFIISQNNIDHINNINK